MRCERAADGRTAGAGTNGVGGRDEKSGPKPAEPKGSEVDIKEVLFANFLFNTSQDERPYSLEIINSDAFRYVIPETSIAIRIAAKAGNRTNSIKVKIAVLILPQILFFYTIQCLFCFLNERCLKISFSDTFEERISKH